jgi:pimeloyl-ACP methyl ester carboxylesterase
VTASVRREDGTAIAYEVTGAGPPVVLVHGLTSHRGSWRPIVERLAPAFRCVSVDLRGHGASSAAGDYAMLALVGDVRAVVEALDLGEPAVVGHSLGATVAAVYAAAHGARAVVCVDQSLRFGDFAARVRPYAEALRGPRTMEAVMAIERDLGPAGHPDLAGMERRVLAFPREVVLGIWEQLLGTPPEQLTATAEAILPRIRAPLLALHGSPPAPDYERWLTGLVLHAAVELWEGAGHMLHLAQPDRFGARLRELL